MPPARRLRHLPREGTTIGKCLLKLVDVDGGEIHFDGPDIARLTPHRFRPLRRDIQMIFQDPFASLNPRQIVAVPTTSGTGSEVGRGALICLRDGRKLVVVSPHLLPKGALCDPEMTSTMPASLTAGTGMDAFTHSTRRSARPTACRSVWPATRSRIKTAHALGQWLELGMLWISQPATPSAEMPFGGVKDSGYGSEGGPEALEGYLVTKSVSILGVFPGNSPVWLSHSFH